MKAAADQGSNSLSVRQDDLDARVERIWKKCEVLIEEATSESAHEREQGSILLRWSVTTCLTINVGALVATLNASRFDPTSRLWAGVWFLGGALIALSVSTILASAFLKMAHSKSRIVKDIKLAMKLNDVLKLEDIDAGKIKGAEAMGGIAIFLSIISVIAFVVGAGIMIDGAL